MRRVIRAIAAMGTRFEVVLEASDATRSGALVPLAEACEDEIRTWHRALTRFEKDSVLSFLHREARSRAVRIDPRLARALAIAREVYTRTNGAFDPVGPGGTLAEVEIDESAVKLLTPGVTLDLGGMAKGLALDAVQELLAEAGPDVCAFIHGGTSSVLIVGRPTIEPGHPRVRTVTGDRAVPVPTDADTTHLSVSSAREAHDGASHLRAWGQAMPAGARTAAVRLSATNADRSPQASGASVLSDAGAWAEAWSTALCVTGDLDSFQAWAQASGARAWAMIDDGAGHRACDVNVPGRSLPETLEFV